MIFKEIVSRLIGFFNGNICSRYIKIEIIVYMSQSYEIFGCNNRNFIRIVGDGINFATYLVSKINE